MRRRNGKSNKILVFFPFFIGLIFSVSFILAFEHKEQCYSWEQYKLTTRWRTHAWNGSILYLWILLNRAKLNTKHGLIILGWRWEKHANFQPVHIIILNCLRQPTWSVNPSISPSISVFDGNKWGFNDDIFPSFRTYSIILAVLLQIPPSQTRVLQTFMKSIKVGFSVERTQKS